MHHKVILFAIGIRRLIVEIVAGDNVIAASVVTLVDTYQSIAEQLTIVEILIPD